MSSIEAVRVGPDRGTEVTDRLVKPIAARLARDTVEREHYLHRRPPVSFAFGLMVADDLVGVVTFGCPPSHHLRLGVNPGNPRSVIELNRLWVHDSMPRNSESWFVSRALKALPAYIVVSYADTARGHLGHVYRALNFRYAGWTDMDRATPRYDYLPVSGGHSRDAFRGGYSERVRRVPKIRYWTVTGDHNQRRHLSRQCRWPDMDWKAQPPPTQGDYTA